MNDKESLRDGLMTSMERMIRELLSENRKIKGISIIPSDENEINIAVRYTSKDVVK